MDGKCAKCGSDTAPMCNMDGVCTNAECGHVNGYAKAAPTRKGMKFEAADSSHERIVSMLEFEGKMFIATEKHVYQKIGDKLVPLTFISADDESDPADFWKK